MSLLYSILCALAGVGVFVAAVRHVKLCLSQPAAVGPSLARWSGIWYVQKVWRGHFEKWNIHAHASGAKIVRVAPRMYSLDDPAAVNILYSIASPHVKSAWYSAFADPRIPDHNLFSARTRTFHAAMRRKMGHMYSMSSIKSYEPYVNDCIETLLRQLDLCADKGQEVDLQRWMQSYAFDVIGAITFGDQVGFLEEKTHDIDGIIKSLEGSNAFATIAGIQPALAPILFALYGNPVRGIKTFTKKLRDRAKNSKSRTKAPGGTTFLEKLDAMYERDPDGYMAHHMDVVAEGNVAAGSDTTSISLTSTLYYVMTSSGTLEKLLEEASKVRKADDVNKPMTFDEGMALPYLQYCIKEALRLHPATGLPMWREIVGEPTVIAGATFPPGSIVGINAWVAHRNPSVYGFDADVFRPERWDPAVTPAEQLDAMEKYYLPFGAGSRTCIGKHISYLEMVKVIPTLLSRYEFDSIDQGLDSWNMWFVKPNSLRCKLRRREDGKSM